jgi:hypothetical protein
MSISNLGNVVGLILSETPPSKTYVLWGKILDPLQPELVQIHTFDSVSGLWVAKSDGGSLEPVSSVGSTTPPVSPILGDTYLIPVGATGVWAGKDNNTAKWNGNQWLFIAPFDGAFLKVNSEDGIIRLFEGGSWIEYQGGSYQLDPVDTVVNLRALDTTDANIYKDKATLYLEETNGVYAFDRDDSTSVDDGNLIIEPTVGPGRWKKTASAISDHDQLTNLQGGQVGEYYHLKLSERDLIAEIEAAKANDSIITTDVGGAIVFQSKSDYLVTLGVSSYGLSLSNQELSSILSASGVTGMLDGTDWDTFNSKANGVHTHTTADIITGVFADGRFQSSNVTQFEGFLNHNNLLNYDINKHRSLDDLSTTATTLWSSQKTQDEITLATQGQSRQAKVINIVDNTLAPPTSVLGDRYILDNTGGGVNAGWGALSVNDIATYDGAAWIGETPMEGWVSYVDDENKDALFVDDGVPAWELRAIATVNHGDLLGLGNDDHTQYYNSTRIDTWLGTKDTGDLSEGSNFYFTDGRVRSTPLTGLSLATSTPVTAADTILEGVGKLEAGKQALSDKGVANGYASLDGTGRIPSSQLTIEALEYKGTWNASTNTPTLIDGTGQVGDFYIISVDGTQDLGGGSVDYIAGEWLVYDGTTWEKTVAGSGFIYSGVAYVDETATPASGVYGDDTKPFATIKEAIDAIPANESCRVICLGESPTFGVSGGAIDASGKTIEIDASGKTLSETENTFINTGPCEISIKCQNFTFIATNLTLQFLLSTALSDTVLSIECTGTFTNNTGPTATYGVLRITSKNLIADRFLIQGGGSSLYLDFDTATLTTPLINGSIFVSVTSRVSCDGSGGLPLFTGSTAGSKITGHYNVQFLCFSSVDTIISHATVNCIAYPFDNDTGLIVEHSDFIISRRFNGNPLTDLTMRKSTIDCNFDGAQSPSYTIVVSGENSITDCIFSGAGIYANGIDSQGTNTDIAESMFIFDTGHYGTWANGNYTDLNDNDVYPRATATLVGTEEIKVKTSAGNYESTTTQDIADLAGVGANNKYSETLLAVNWVLDAGTTYYQDVIHGFNSEDVLVEVFDSTTKETVLVEVIDRTDANTIRIKIEGNTDELRVVVFNSGIGVVQQAQDIAVVNPTTPYIPTAGDVIDWDCTAGNKVVNLPDASLNTSMQINVSKSDATANTITINALGGDLINGVSSLTITLQYVEVFTLFSTGTRWLLK